MKTAPRMRPSSCLSLGYVLLLACTGASEVQYHGVIHVDNAPLWGERVRLHEELRIGQLDGSPEYALGRVDALAVSREGSIFVYDGAARIIRQFDSSGAWVANVGREGRGPGEYRRVNGMRVLPDGRLAIWDAGNARITVYDTDRHYADNYRVPTRLNARRSFAIDTLGNFYVLAWNPGGAEGPEIPKFLIKISHAGEVLDTIPLPREDRTGPRFVVPTAEGRRYLFSEATLWAWSPLGYLVVGRNSEYAFELLIPGASPRRFVRRFTPVKLESDERRLWHARIERFYQRRGRPEAPAVVTPSEPQQGPDLPEAKPAYRNLWTDDDGRIWVERYVRAVKLPLGIGSTDSSLREPPTFDVIEADGTFLGTIVLPANTFIHVRRDDLLWGVQTGSFDEPYVVRFRIVPDG